MRNKIIICVIFLLCSFTVLFAKEESLKEPAKNQVMLVGRISLLQEINNDFYFKTFALGDSLKDKRHMYGFSIIPNGNLHAVSRSAVLGDYFFVNVKIPRSGKFPLDGFYIFLFAEGEKDPFERHIYLPFGMDVQVSSENRYVYIGSFRYGFAGDNFMVDDVQRRDEFDEAQDILNVRLGKEVPLTRAVLMEPEEKQKK